jgi:hypothetical protein
MKAGSTITVDYHRSPEDDYTFGHVIGPMTAYLARCPDDGCENVDLSAKMWFKIWEAGLLSGTWLQGHWAMRDIYEGASLEISTPANLRPGKYILKHDMINLETGPLQLFPNCVHLDISGDGDGFPSDENLVSFPGGYDKDQGRLSYPRVLRELEENLLTSLLISLQGFGLPPKGANGFDWLHGDNADKTVSAPHEWHCVPVFTYERISNISRRFILCPARRSGKAKLKCTVDIISVVIA